MSRLDLNSALHSNRNVYAASEVNPQGVAATNSKAAQAAVTPGDQTSVSLAAGLVAKSLSGDDVRSAKVVALQQSIAAGTYNVPAGALADKLIGSLLAGR